MKLNSPPLKLLRPLGQQLVLSHPSMVSTQFGLRHETPFADSPPHSIVMTDPNNLQQLQNHIAEMERRQKEELTRLKADHDQLEACVRRSQSDEQSTHTLPERTQGESHPRRINNSANNLSPSYMHCPVARTVCQHPFIDRIMEADILLGWKPLNLERYNGTTNPDEHLDAFLTHANLYTNDDAILCLVFPTSLKGAELTWYNELPPRSIDTFDTFVK